jgi:hypothetical protein
MQSLQRLKSRKAKITSLTAHTKPERVTGRTFPPFDALYPLTSSQRKQYNSKIIWYTFIVFQKSDPFRLTNG